MKKQFLIIFLTIFTISIFGGMDALAQQDAKELSSLSPQIKSKLRLHFSALEKKDQAAFKKSISQLFPSRNITDIYNRSVMHYPHCNGAQHLNKAKQISLKALKKKHNIVLRGKGNKVVIEEGFLVLMDIGKKIPDSQRLPLDAMNLPQIKSFTAGYGFPPSYTIAIIIDATGFIWGGDGPN